MEIPPKMLSFSIASLKTSRTGRSLFSVCPDEKVWQEQNLRNEVLA